MTNIASFGGQFRLDGVREADGQLSRFTSTSRRATGAIRTKTAETKRASNQLRRMGSSIAVLDGPLGGIASRFRSLGTLIGQTGFAVGALMIGVGSLSLVFRSWLGNTIRQEQAEVMLAQSIRATGREAELSVGRLIRLAQARQQVTTFGDEETIEAMARMAQFDQIGSGMFDRAIVSAQDFAIATGTNLTTAANNLGIALQNPIEGLERLNRSTRAFTEADRAMIEQLQNSGRLLEAQAFILDRLDTRIQGASETIRDTFGGALSALGNAMGDLVEVTGGPLSALTAIVNAVADNLDLLVNSFKLLATIVAGRVLRSLGSFIMAKNQQRLAVNAVVRSNINELQAQIANEAATRRLLRFNMAFAASQAQRAALGERVTNSLIRETALTNALSAAQARGSIVARGYAAALGLLRGALTLIGGWVGIVMLAIGGLFLAWNRFSRATEIATEATRSLTDPMEANADAVRDLNSLSLERIAILNREAAQLRRNAQDEIELIEARRVGRRLVGGADPIGQIGALALNQIWHREELERIRILNEAIEASQERQAALVAAQSPEFQTMRAHLAAMNELQGRASELSEAEVNTYRQLLEVERDRLQARLATSLLNQGLLGSELDPAAVQNVNMLTSLLGGLDETMGTLDESTEELLATRDEFFEGLLRQNRALEVEAEALGMTADAAQRFRLEQQLLAEALSQGIDTTTTEFLERFNAALEEHLGWLVEISKQEATNDSADQFLSDVSQMEESLREQIATVGMSEDALLRYRASILGVTDKMEPLIDQLREANRAFEIEEFNRALTEQIETLGMSDGALLRYRAAALGAGEETRDLIKEFEVLSRAAEQTEQVERLTESLKDQVATFGMSRFELMRYRARVAGAGEELETFIAQLERQNAELEENNKILRAADDAQRRRNAIFEQTRTPLEEYRAGIRELNELYGDNRPQEYERAVEQLQQRFVDSQPIFASARSSVSGFFSDIASGTNILDAATAALQRFLDRMIDSSVEQLFDILGGQVFDLAVDSTTDLAQEATKGTAHGQASGAIIGTAMVTSGTLVSKEFMASIVGAGATAAAQMAAAISAAGTANSAGSILTKVASFVGGKALGGVVMAGQSALVGENGVERIRHEGNRTSVIPVSNQNQNSGGVNINISSIDAGGLSREEAEELVFNAGREAVTEAVRKSDENTDRMFHRAFQQPRLAR